jgi:hypothetical protein
MPTYYKQIPGWFYANELFDIVIKSINSPSLFVEIGSWMGRSGCYMSELIKENNKPVELHMIDLWGNAPNDHFYGKWQEDKNDFLKNEHIRVVKEVGNDLYKIVQYYFNKFQLCDRNVKFVRKSSAMAVKDYKDKSIDFLYIDAGHDYGSVKADISLYLPKMKKGSIISGDDYCIYFPSVITAVNEIFKNVNVIGERVWWKQIV